MDGLLFAAVLVIAGLGAGLVAMGALYRKTAQRQAAAERALSQAETRRGQLAQQLSAILRISQKFVEAGDENEVIETILHEIMQTTGALGASFVPLDERGKPRGAVRRGEFPFPVPDAWLEYLASTSVRQTCQQCKILEHHSHDCVLLKGPYSEANGIYCYPLRHSGREMGMLNLYIPQEGFLDEQQQAFLRSLADAAGLAMAGERLRQREFLLLSQLRSARQKSDLRATLAGMAENLREIMNADLVFVRLVDALDNEQDAAADGAAFWQHTPLSGELATEERTALAETAIETIETNQMLSQASSPQRLPGRAHWISLPLQISATRPSQGQACLGALFVAGRSSEGFSNRQLALARGMADQMALLVQSTTQLADLQYQAIMDERTRLAREIHDGLAQTLGFLKLQVAQMLGYHERGDAARLGQALHTSYDALAAAYQDARQAIDGLRITPGGPGANAFENWLRQTVAESSHAGGQNPLTITISALEVRSPLPPEVHAQLIRIVQEALSNVRKHARAAQAWISCVETGGDLLLEIRDDGRGFATDSLMDPSRYGLRGMRERAELLGADFQVISRPDEGTIVRIRLPLTEFLRMEAR